MGAEQAATTMAIVMEESARARGLEPDRAEIDGMRAKIVETFERQTIAFYTSGRMLDDGVIDPRDTRRVLGFVLSLFRRSDRVAPQAARLRRGASLTRRPSCNSPPNTKH